MQQHGGSTETEVDAVLAFEQEVGRRIAVLRKDRGWSQDEMADRIQAAGGRKMDRSALSRLESGRPIRLAEAASIARAFDVPLGVLVGEPADHSDMEQARLISELRRRIESMVGAIAAMLRYGLDEEDRLWVGRNLIDPERPQVLRFSAAEPVQSTPSPEPPPSDEDWLHMESIRGSGVPRLAG